MRAAILLLVAITTTSVTAEDWTPPADPNPTVILSEARADTRAGRYETALAKHVWIHENAVKISPSMYGVRLSFALAGWRELTELYPPALAKLKAFRDEAKKNVLQGHEVRTSFHEMDSINDQLGDHDATVSVFQTLVAKNPKAAQSVFQLAKPSLVLAKEYALLKQYVRPMRDLASMRRKYDDRNKKLTDETRFHEQQLEFATKKFINDATTLVAILAVSGQQGEAATIATAARSALDDAAFHKSLEKALEGEFPEPWPPRSRSTKAAKSQNEPEQTGKP